ncbi:hypothetical protein [Candidatus Epulonipiscium viviparus]|nr:hypothetical protein [Candidatus Epulopiscium viviparus]
MNNEKKYVGAIMTVLYAPTVALIALAANSARKNSSKNRGERR